MQEIEKFLEEASKRYYEGDPIISDERFDALAESVGWKKVGFNQDPESEYHEYPMYSLKKYFIGEDSVPNTPAIMTPKLDGSAISLLYKNGVLIKALTRGDGIKGKNITEKVRHIVPNKLNMIGRMQITGEVVVPLEYENARNIAAGSLNLKSIQEVKERPLTFIAYDAQPHRLLLWSEEMQLLSEEYGFKTILDSDYKEFPKDGHVFRVDDNDEFIKLGYTSHHPRGAWAVKKQKEAVVTKLLDVVWQVGRSGRITPVAILEPVEIEGASVSRATLNNYNFITELGLEIGCYVEIVRSGEIIPKVLARVD